MRSSSTATTTELPRGRDGRRAARRGSTCRPAGAASPSRSTREVVPRGEWERHALGDGARVEVLTRDPGRLSGHRRSRPTAAASIAGRELRSRAAARHRRLPLARGAGRGDRGERHRARHRRAAARRPGGARLDHRRARRARASSCCPNTAGCYTARDAVLTAQARARGVRDRLGQARGDRRRAHAAARRARAARGRRGARRRRLRRAAVHERRPDPRAPPGGRRLRRGDAARLADRLRHGHPATPTTSR